MKYNTREYSYIEYSLGLGSEYLQMDLGSSVAVASRF